MEGSDDDDHFATVDIPEGGNYFEAAHALIGTLLGQLVEAQGVGAAELFDSVAATVVSVCGVVERNRTLLQLPLWHSPSPDTVRWTHDGKLKEFFDFKAEVTDIVRKLVTKRGSTWSPAAIRRYQDTVFVVNDTSACAAAAYAPPDRDFIFLKMHAGLGVGTVGPWIDGQAIVRTNHPEAGHGYPLPHLLDNEANFPGVCQYHHFCFEGMACVHSLTRRARLGQGAFAAWQPALKVLEQRLSGQRLDNAFLRHILAEDRVPPSHRNLGVDILAHYSAQLVHQLSVGPGTPAKVVIGGRMASPAVLEAIRENVSAWTKNYPKWRELTAAGIEQYIVASSGYAKTIELQGALAIAEGMATAKPQRGRQQRLPQASEWPANVVPITRGREINHAKAQTSPAD